MSRKDIWPELDLLRGFAVFLMLLNHSVISWTGLSDTNNLLLNASFFIGSFAPVVFFLVTGIGYGLSHQVGMVKPFSTVFF